MKLSKDYFIEGKIIPKGTEIHITKFNESNNYGFLTSEEFIESTYKSAVNLGVKTTKSKVEKIYRDMIDFLDLVNSLKNKRVKITDRGGFLGKGEITGKLVGIDFSNLYIDTGSKRYVRTIPYKEDYLETIEINEL